LRRWETARSARLWNKANGLCVFLRHTAEPVAKEILDAWFGDAHKPNLEDDEALRQIDELETTHRSGPAGNPVESRTR
jgi:ribose 5-phosphate isomerase B